MNLVVLTQNDSFFLPLAIDYFFRRTCVQHKVVACVLFNASPYGKRESFIAKAYKTYCIFGLYFFLSYSLIYLVNRLNNRDVRSVLAKHDIKIVELTGDVNSEDSLAVLRNYEPDLFVSIAGNQIFKPKLFNLPRYGTVNLHTALLPKYRGLLPSFWVIHNQEKYTGVSVFLVDEGIDSGPIIVQKKINITGMSQLELIRITKIMGMDAIIEAIDLLSKGNVKFIENKKEEATYYSFPTRMDVKKFRAVGGRFF